MWRCKWAELRVKELESQASRYTREISVKYSGNHTALDQISVEQSGSKLLPYVNKCYSKRPMKRRKRKRVEDITDIASYMSSHVLFSDRGWFFFKYYFLDILHDLLIFCYKSNDQLSNQCIICRK